MIGFPASWGFLGVRLLQVKMFRVILWQTEATLLAAAVGVLIAGWRGLISAALGGAACVLPSLFLALYLKRVSEHSGMDFLVRFLLGEIVKLALVAGLLFVVVAGGGGGGGIFK
jgi:F0F1-type ATP synthase assembly protein I